MFIRSSIGEHLGCFHVFPIVNNAAMNMRAQMSRRCSLFISFGCTPTSGLLDHMIVLILLVDLKPPEGRHWIHLTQSDPVFSSA